MGSFRNEGDVLPESFQKNCVFFRSKTTEGVLPPCSPEKMVELCFQCIEGIECREHPSRRKIQSGVACFADDDFNLVDAHHIRNVHESPDEDNAQQDHCEQTYNQSLISAAEPSTAPSKRSLKSEEHFHEEVMPVSEIPRKRFSRFRAKTFVCDVCDAAFTLKQNVQSHLFIYHVQKDGTMKQHTRLMYKCDNCDKVFKSPHAADVHFKKAHKKPAVRPPTDCEECGKRFASAFQLREHISIQHLKERNFICEECGQKFGRRGGLRRHVQMVHQNHLHMCPYEGCGHPGYKCSKALTAHIRSVHTNVRPYVCDTCGKAFVRRNDLKMHTLTHTSETAFHCECGSKFRRLIYLKKHQRLCIARNGDATCDNAEALDDNGEAVEDSDEHDL
uniref:Zinc finger domain containing protein n=1 Tax=Haemonchus contortus TaxID=6289 RepID=A0A7I4Y4Q6_HAECO